MRYKWGSFFILPGLPPVGEDIPHNTIVALADEEVEGALLPRVVTARPPARAIKLDATACDEGPDSEDLLVCDATMRLPGAVPAYACHDVFDCTEVLAMAPQIPASTLPQNVVEGIIAMSKIQRCA